VHGFVPYGTKFSRSIHILPILYTYDIIIIMNIIPELKWDFNTIAMELIGNEYQKF